MPEPYGVALIVVVAFVAGMVVVALLGLRR